MSSDLDEDDFVAVIGMAGRFPGARDVEEFWENLCQERESVSVLHDQLATAEPGHVPSYGVLAGAGEFDAEFFGYSDTEAMIIDPQQRLLLECAHEALERAGHGGPERLPTGVFVGGSSTDHAAHVRLALDRIPAVPDPLIHQANDLDFLSSRVAYKLGLTGPALTVQTACSSALVAVHVAVQALLAGDCALALAGGASVLAHLPRQRVDPDGNFSPDGHCRPFDAAGRGTVPACAVGLVVLRPLADAVADGDHVHAVVRGTAVNNDGRDKVGFSAPGVSGQAEVVRAAHLVAGVRPEEIGYLEAHGTATAFGDPIEVAALTRAFGGRSGGTCRIGSVKSNVGHADAAAGIVGLIKTVLAVEHGVLPASLHFTEPNPEIDFGSSPFVVNDRTRAWTTEGRPRIAGTHAIGVGGTNAHAVVAQPPPVPDPTPGRPHQLLVLSARTPGALDRAAELLAEHLERHPDTRLADVAWTLQTGRTAHPLRRFVVATDAAGAAAALRAARPAPPAPATAARGLLFVFADDDVPPPGTATPLYTAEPVFRAAFDEVAETAVPHLGTDLRQPVAGDEPAVRAAAAFAVQYATARLLAAWGVVPAAVAGRGAGAYTAACLAGTFPLEVAVRLLSTSSPDGSPEVPAGLAPPRLPLVSEVTGDWADPAAVASAQYWAHRRAGGTNGAWPALRDTRHLLVGIGTGRALPGSGSPVGIEVLAEADRSGSAAAATAAGRLWAAGIPVDFSAMHSGERRRRVRLPTYPFARKTHLIPPPAATGVATDRRSPADAFPTT